MSPSKNYTRLDYLEDTQIDEEMNNSFCLNTQVNLNRYFIYVLHRHKN